jgi:hypothetical protein
VVASALAGGASTTLPFSVQILAGGGIVSQTPMNLGFLTNTSAAQQTAFSVNAQGSALSYGINYIPASAPLNPLPAGAVQIISGAYGTIAAGGTNSVIVQVSPANLAAGVYQGYFQAVVPGTSPVQVLGYSTLVAFVGNGSPSLVSWIPASPGPLNITVPAGFAAGNLNQPANITITAVGDTSSTPLFVGNVPGIGGVTAPTISTPANFPTGMTACFLPYGAGVSSTTQQPPCELRVTPTQSDNPTCSVWAPSPQNGSGYRTCSYAISVDTTLLPAATYNSAITFTATNGLTLSVPVSVTVTATPGVVVKANVPQPLGGTQLLPVTALSFSGVAGQNVTYCQSIQIGATGGTVTGLSLTTANPWMAVSNDPSTILQFGTGFFQSVQFGVLTNPSVWNTNVCVNAVAQPRQPAVLNGQITIASSGGNPVVIPVTFTLSGGTGSASNLQQIGVFRGQASGLGVFALDVSGTYNYAASTTKFRFFGLNGDQPVAGDWFGTGVVSLGVFRAGQWYIDANNNGVWDGVAGGDVIWSFGLPGDMAIVGDWTGDGKSKIGVMRCPAVGQCTWYLDAGNKHGYDPATVVTAQYGLPGDKPVANNWSGTGMADQIGVFRCPAAGVCTWIVDSFGAGAYQANDAQYFYGLTGDYPIVGNWFGTGRKRIGVFRSGQVILNVSGTNVFQSGIDFFGSFGLNGDLPVIGLWTQFP